MSPSLSTLRTRALCVLAATVVAAATLTASGAGAQASDGKASSSPSAARATNPVTPGDFTGFGFDQCLAPNQKQMDTWLATSPYLAVGIYISGDSRACRSQPNLTPTWVATQLAKGWRLLPITLGPQASCQPRFPRYSDDVKIDPNPGTKQVYGPSRRQGVAEADKTVKDAAALGIVRGSTLWYDLEGFDSSNERCRESALSFLSGWTTRLHKHGYVSGVYSSAGSGIAALDSARINRPTRFTLPDMIWVARWDGVANTSSSYLREDGWRPGRRVKQYKGGHDEVHGGVRINIDTNFLEVGRGSVATPETRCGGINVSFSTYPVLRPPANGVKPSKPHVKALQCLLKEKGLYQGNIGGGWSKRLVAAMNAYQRSAGLGLDRVWWIRGWVSVLASGDKVVLKRGSVGPAVRRVQRALNATGVGKAIAITGVFDARTDAKLRAWQAKAKVPVNGVMQDASWAPLLKGRR
ncbi:DUF1906 domain-containing protein [Nocardioides sp. cx-169]|uniref:glycoside hydrolase domain-containing protein n=1 Tax=Nocardioides sp. cx-169 TaxID=2899080 RepID=UPI001E6037B4|nr:glycoside hydrolase domain-containing protein [Nocardioides sp. cx-169]MCD4533415.1 DUF1906 domain-containing protein [Nocardioides sp. cx-169]